MQATQVGDSLVKRKMLEESINYKIILGKNVVTRHRMMAVDMKWKTCKREKCLSKVDSKIWW